MKRLERIAVYLVSGLVLTTSTHAEDVVSPKNPYAPIADRNVFGLNPPPPPGSEQPSGPPPQITPNGIMSIFGRLQVLFKVSDTNPGEPAKNKFYTLREGERQDDIEVTHIDEKASIVTFNNHGIMQEIPLASASVSTPAPDNGENIGPGRGRGHMIDPIYSPVR
jgi:hypothetical protein